MTKRVLLAIGLLVGFGLTAHDHYRARTPVRIPDVPGYRTLKCDFHIHTVFSDGTVWPHIRSEEAWREGLDAIAITDHIEYQPHQNDLPTNHNRSFEIAKPHGDALQVTVIRGSEITRGMPPGHLNAIFLTDAAALDTKEWRDAIQEAHAQGAFIFWNHPGWTGQQTDGVARWYAEHTELLEQGRLHGIEVVNGREYYPEAHRWCLEHGLALISNSDVHNPLNLDYDLHRGDHRPMTLVFARDASTEAIREALFARRTAVYANRRLIGDAQFLKPIFERSIELRNPRLRLEGRRSVHLQIHNRSDIDFALERIGSPEHIEAPSSLTLPSGRTVLFTVRARTGAEPGPREARVPYRVKNLLVAPDQGLEIDLRFEIEVVPAG